MVVLSKEINGDEDGNRDIILLTNLVREGNQRIQGYALRGILLLGDTGVGKSTIACILSGKRLRPVKDDETEELHIALVDESNDPNDIVIGHHAFSETKIPNMCRAGEVVIWDCPGFDDTDPVQEIANRFYIKRLFEITKQLKFVLVVPESDLRGKKGSDFLDTVSTFIDMFEDAKYAMGSTTLIVTKVTKNKKASHIRKSIEDILAHHQRVGDAQKKLIKDMLPSLQVFHEPSDEETTIQLPGLLEAIDSRGEYLDVNEKMVTVSISKAGKKLTSNLLNTARNNFDLIVGTIADAIREATNCINVSKTNAFCEKHPSIKEWVPASVFFNDKREEKKEHFLHLELLSKLLDATRVSKIFKISEAINIFQSTLEVFSEFAERNLLRQIHDFGYCLQQQHEYVKFFTSVCEVEQPSYSDVYELLKISHEKTKENLKSAVVNLVINENNTDQGYHQRAIHFLKNYQDSDECRKHLSVAYKCLGVITQPQDVGTALVYFVKSVEAHKEQPETYEKLGELFTTIGQFDQAIECYKVINNVFRIKMCFKLWLKEEGNNPSIMMDQADYFASIGLLELAKKHYHHAFGLSKDSPVKTDAWEKLSAIMLYEVNDEDLGNNLKKRVENKDFYNFSTVNDDFVKTLLDKIDSKISTHSVLSSHFDV